MFDSWCGATFLLPAYCAWCVAHAYPTPVGTCNCDLLINRTINRCGIDLTIDFLIGWAG